jgi:glycerophosphoryl diester phosphodiesterase
VKGLTAHLWPAIVAHRGASASHPENTLAAFEAAIGAGADMVELDVRLTADGVLVVIHDPDVSTTTSGHGFVSELTVQQIKHLDIAHSQMAPERIPTLREALSVLVGRVAVEIEIKNAPDEPGFEPSAETAVRAVAELVTETGFELAFVASFDPDCIGLVRTLAPSLITGLLVGESIDLEAALDSVTEHGHQLLLPDVSAVKAAGADFVDEAHDRGVRLCVWTVDDPIEIGSLFAAGIDAVETNDPSAGIPARDLARTNRSFQR